MESVVDSVWRESREEERQPFLKNEWKNGWFLSKKYV